MTSRLIDCEPGSDLWLAERSTRITGSDVSAILGLHPFKTPMQVWADKTGRGQPFETNEAIEAGNRLEASVAQWWLEEKAPKGTVIKKAPGLYVDEDNDWLAGTPDFLVYWPGNCEQHQGDGGKPSAVLEVKTTRSMRYDGRAIKWNWELEAPMMHQCQNMMYAHLLYGCESHIAGLVGGQQFRAHEYSFEPEFVAKVIAYLADWRETYILGDIMPPHVARDVDLLKHLAGETDASKTVQLQDKQPMLDFVRFKEEEAEAKDKKQLSQATMIRAMMDAERAEFPDGSFFTYKADRNGRRTPRAYPEPKGSSDESI